MWGRQSNLAYLGKSAGATIMRNDGAEVIDKKGHHLQRPAQATSAAIADEATDIAAKA